MLKLVSNVCNIPIIQKLLLTLHRNPHILYYHFVGTERPEYYQNPITSDIFRFQIVWLLKNKFEFVPLDAINKQEKDKRRVAITTDDGFTENYTCIAPILTEYKIPATFFLINNCIDNKDLMWINKLFVLENIAGANETRQQVYHILRDKQILSDNFKNIRTIYQQIPMKLKEEIVNQIWGESKLPKLSEYLEINTPYMSSKQIRELLSSGFTIGAHTLSHPKCSQLSIFDLKNEIINSMNQLRSSFNTPIDFFAYPFGLRPGEDAERDLFRLSGAKAFLGTKNSDSKLDGNIIWERDKMEQPKAESLFWFSLVPLARKFLLRPLGIYK